MNFTKYHKATLCLRDYVGQPHIRHVPLKSFNMEEFKVKILPNQGLDIVSMKKNFISDVKLDENIKNHIRNIPVGPPLTKENYEEEKFWALTSRLRGYDVKFYQVGELPHEQMDLAVTKKLKYFFDENINVDDTREFCNCNFLVVEYDNQKPISYSEIESKLKSYVVKYFDEDDKIHTVVITANPVQVSAWEKEIHSDEGTYESGINTYGNKESCDGIILMGEQNDNNTYNYGMAIYDNVIVPDLYIK
ncbi:unknown [Choristoneura occidentalis granulovirus]|uniref:ORF11 n=2 Tax=Betabaculovirus chofumiferanae TaxID=3051997 RepID=Q8JL56_GVCF|nr:unknown [Choristoneura fumiferana granulovirus]AAM60754.1 ORF11 [Choristoneura fumiferana granulovirus]ABC61145.1 unknown [Choristoneura fumiferana granulovirus]